MNIGIKRAFTAMNIIKNKLKNRVCDSWMNNYFVTCIEKDMFDIISNKEIMCVILNILLICRFAKQS
jgi:hypothetical protein